ncbi:MAG: extracellular solute-binding protein [Kosmotogaceae bacterium]|nr:extracellular solute-binding protein [Kosmotogaceae bacterium]
MKRFFVSVLLTLLCSAAFGITFWVSWEGEEFYRDAAAAFKEETGIDVEIVYFPRIEEKLNINLKTGDLPDAAMIKDTYVGDVASSGRNLCLALSSLKGYPQGFLNVYKWNGEMSAVPYYADCQVAFVNLNAFEEAGIVLGEKLDFDQLEAIKDSLTGIVDYPIAFDFTSPYVMFPYVSALLSQEEQYTLEIDTSGSREVVSRIKEYFDEGVISRLERAAMNKLFTQGKIGIMLQGSYMASKFREKGPDFVMLPFPNIEGIEVRGIIDSKGFALFNGDTFEQCMSFIGFLNEHGHDFFVEYDKYPLFGTDSHQELESIVNQGKFMPNFPGYQSLLFEALEPALQAIYSGAMTVDQALSGAQSYIDSIR